FCKLEVINTEGHSKFVQRALYSGDHHLLGVLLAPDEKVMYYLEERNVNWFTKAGRRSQEVPSAAKESGAL
ncbi:MAG: Trypsin-like serine protease, partial [Paenibacillus sp.]|nr:Trypsin-like serine protease [Paenibacillus sp.]